MTDWIDSMAALERLGVKAQTLYAYVSRGLVETRRDPDRPRQNLYRADDIAALGQRRTRSRKRAAIATGSMAWGDPSLVTAISTVHRGRLVYRGQDAALLAEDRTLEQVAALLWQSDSEPVFSGPETPHDTPFAALATLIPDSRASLGRGSARLCRDAQEAIGVLAQSCGIPCGRTEKGGEALHRRLARLWSLDAGQTELIRRALVLVADHELNVSTFATRVVASSGASLSASLLAGACALSGPRHGGATAALTRLMQECAATGMESGVHGWLDRHGHLPGFGHPLYPAGDVRALALLPHLPDDPTHDRVMRPLAACVLEATGQLPNIDYALVALARACGLPASAPFTLFLLGRSVGWAAHAMEQAGQNSLIRPRAVYQGLLPEGGAD